MKRQRKIIFNSKNNLVSGHSFMRPQKSLNFGSAPPSSLLSTNIQFWSKHTPLLDVPNWYSTPTVQHIDYSSLMHKVFTFLIHTKPTQKPTDFHQVDFCERLMYLQCSYDRTTSQIQKKFQDGNSVIENRKCNGTW